MSPKSSLSVLLKTFFFYPTLLAMKHDKRLIHKSTRGMDVLLLVCLCVCKWSCKKEAVYFVILYMVVNSFWIKIGKTTSVFLVYNISNLFYWETFFNKIFFFFFFFLLLRDFKNVTFYVDRCLRTVGGDVVKLHISTPLTTINHKKCCCFLFFFDISGFGLEFFFFCHHFHQFDFLCQFL